jgi:hypothetical protein
MSCGMLCCLRHALLLFQLLVRLLEVLQLLVRARRQFLFQ